MEVTENWIWLPEDRYPQLQKTRYSERDGLHPQNYAVASFSRDYSFDKSIEKVILRCSGDTAFTLLCNGRQLFYGPILPGGDFLAEYNSVPLPSHYAAVLEISSEEDPALSGGRLCLWAMVRMGPSRCFDYSMGHGGFFLAADIHFADGSSEQAVTNSSWRATWLPEYMSAGSYDNSLPEEPSVYAVEIPNVWNCTDAPIPPCTLLPLEAGKITIPGKQKVAKRLELDKIYAGYLRVRVTTAGKLRIRLFCRELDEQGTEERCTFVRSGEYLALELRSIGNIWLEAENEGCENAELTVAVIRSHYPAPYMARTSTSDEGLNQVLETCLHTLKYCRQSIHLDSPKHCEPLACTGDYYIETLMTAFSYGDMRLAAFDVRRTAQLLRCRDGRMFHTTYSLIWVQMLWDVYMLTGEYALLEDCADALTLLLERFAGYLGDNGLPETAPDYMFVDWLVPDGISLHHPPKALGQACLCMYYYGALKTASRIWNTLGKTNLETRAQQQAESLHSAITRHLYDPDRKLFFEGLNTPTREDLIGEWMPQNVRKRYYRKNANILAAYFGFFDREECADLLERILEEDSLGEVQPYFCHFLLDAVYRNGLREKYSRKLLEQWKAPVRECPKGLAEGFYKPEESYSFDHSHAWGGTPAYALPLALSGLEILEPGFRKIRLDPALLGLTWAEVEIPTPCGAIRLHMQKDTSPEITVPDGIILV